MMNRRKVIKALATGGALIGVSVLMPGLALAEWNKEAFSSDNQTAAMKALLGAEPTESADVHLKAPSIAENGAVVPVTVKTAAANVESISLFVEGNPTPLVAEFLIPTGTLAEVSTRIRMGKTSKITAVVKADGQLLSASQETKVTIGGCGG